MPRQCAHWLAMTISLQTTLPVDCCFLHRPVIGAAQHPLNTSCRARRPHRAGQKSAGFYFTVQLAVPHSIRSTHHVGPDALIGPAGQKSADFYFTVQLAGRNSSLNFSRANTSVMPFPMGPSPMGALLFLYPRGGVNPPLRKFSGPAARRIYGAYRAAPSAMGPPSPASTSPSSWRAGTAP